MTPHASLFPPDWNHGSVLHEELAAVLSRSDCGWTQTCCALGFAIACIVASYDDEARRVAMAETIAAKLLDAAESGRVPGETVQ